MNPSSVRVRRSDGGHIRRHRPDYSLVLISGILLMLGMIVIYAVSPALSQRSIDSIGDNHFFYRQLVFVAMGIAAFLATSLFPIRLWRSVQPALVIASVVASIALFVPGLRLEVNGAVRWIDLGIISFQPSELIKFTIVMYFAAFLSERIRQGTLNDRSFTLNPVLVVTLLLSLDIVIVQRDMGTMISVVAIIMTMLWTAKVRLRDLGIMLGALGAGGALTVLLFPHRMARILTFLNPESDVDGAGYHINQALIAIGSGGVIGKGLGRSVQVYGYLPEAANDSIFAILAEKFGFIGSVVVIFLYAALFLKILRVIERAPNMHMRLIASGVFAWLFSHTIINIGAMLSLLPLTGITLPFLSLGGTSLIFMMAALGLIFNISRYCDLTPYEKGGADGTVHSVRRGQRRSRYAHTIGNL